MTYHVGIGHSLAAAMGVPEDDPHISCDGCGARREVACTRGIPYVWFLRNRPPPRWRLDRTETEGGVIRVDLCPSCRDTGTPPEEP